MIEQNVKHAELLAQGALLEKHQQVVKEPRRLRVQQKFAKARQHFISLRTGKEQELQGKILGNHHQQSLHSRQTKNENSEESQSQKDRFKTKMI